MPAINTNEKGNSQTVEYSREFIPAKHDCLVTVIGLRRKPNSTTSNHLLALRSSLIISQQIVYLQDLIYH